MLRFLETLECTSNFREPTRKFLLKLRAHLRKCGDTGLDMFEHKHQVLSLELIRDTAHDCRLRGVLVVDMKLQSQLTEWVDNDKRTFPRVDLDISTYKAFTEELDIDPESCRIF